MESGAREVEITLRVRGTDRPAVAGAVAELEEISGYRLGRRETVTLEDLYFDTPDGDLGSEGLALRLRRRAPADGNASGGSWIVALKGDERRLDGGGVSRLERETRWAAGTAGRIRRWLAGCGIELPGDGDRRPAGAPRSGDGASRPAPAAALRDLGLTVIQRRSTRRRRLDVAAPDGGPVGEMVLDRVVYRLPGGEARAVVHHEVEIEARGPGAEETVTEVSAALRRRFGDALRPWGHNKLATGRALERLAARGELSASTEPDGLVSDRGYDRIEAMLEGPGE